MFCQYYQAIVKKQECYFVSAILRSFENLAFQRTLEKDSSLWEFFVTKEKEEEFLQLFDFFCKKGLVSNLKKCTNRLLDESEEV